MDTVRWGLVVGAPELIDRGLQHSMAGSSIGCSDLPKKSAVRCGECYILQPVKRNSTGLRVEKDLR